MTLSQATWTKRMRSTTTALLAALCGGVGAGAFLFNAPESGTPLSPAIHSKSKAADPVPTAFTDAQAGACVNWMPGPKGANTDFATVDCAQNHRFEVATREDLGTYPTSEFGPESRPPGKARQEKLTNELCVGPTLKYLKGKLDPEGRYSIAPILPPKSAWAAGDRTMLCGVMVIDEESRAVETRGLAAQQDQSRVSKPDTCVLVKGNTTTETTCDRPHSWQVTKLVDLSKTFSGPWPGVEKQNQHLNKVCTDAAREYLGGDDALYNSTLAPFWTTLQKQSWDAGSRSVNCALTFGKSGGSFATLQGDVRQSFTIDGQPPAKQPKRNPLRKPGDGAGSTPGNAGAAGTAGQAGPEADTGAGANQATDGAVVGN
ncbi:septum formation family protein [Corynebacterium auriscanis]|uniref:septum formation family protein n=1 Tax=Corynebacterium auriscanis TaxID=99807 RepID=UPI0009FF41D6|nr:septum formation family protein [Corynebacterium auriscanis]MCX2163979.1 septum formation family protein [Corynebacterium auriscanis]WJY71874.1 putative membrane protein [Corynebacterium auriscanis]